MRRLLLPILLLAVAIGATVQMNRANEEADPGRAVGISTDVDLATPIFSARRAPEWLRNPRSDTMLVDAINTVLRTDETPPLSCVLVERDGERMAASNTAAAIRTDELHRLITATVIDAGGIVRALDDAQRLAWVEAMKPVWNQFEGDVGAENIAAAQAINANH